MNRWKAAFFVAIAGLAISIALRRNGPTPNSPPASSVSAPSPNTAAVARYDLACSVELETCKKQNWGIVLDAIRSDASDRLRQLDAGREGGAPNAGAEEQRRALDGIARKQLHEHRKEKQGEILASIRDVGTDAWIRQEIPKTLDKVSPALALGEPERARLRDGYKALWSRHGPELQALVTATPVDGHALLEAVRSIYRDEDALYEEKLGHDASERYRIMELDGRTAILGILAVIADEPWDENIVW